MAAGAICGRDLAHGSGLRWASPVLFPRGKGGRGVLRAVSLITRQQGRGQPPFPRSDFLPISGGAGEGGGCRRFSHWLRGRCGLGLLLMLLLACSAPGATETVLVASPFPKALLSAYKQAFDAQSPDYRVEFVNFPATNTIAYFHDRAPGSRIDVFWGSSPDTFHALRRHGLLQSLAHLSNPAIPENIGPLAVDDPAYFYRGQALFGYGIMWNKSYFEARGLPPPRTWADLSRADYFGHIVMPSASRSSTTHLIVEAMLQGLGWDAGWALILRIAGNCATITERTFDVPDSITRGRFGLGPVVDFLALSGKYSGFPVEFTYVWPGAITPASIALISGARNPEGGKAFIAFTLSEAGQRLLLRPEISRLPVLPSVYDSADRPADYPNLSRMMHEPPPDYAPSLSEVRYQMVGALFDQLITFRHRKLVAITQSMHEVAGLLRQHPHPEAEQKFEQARELVYRAPIAEDDALLTHQLLKTREQIAAIALQEAAWARQTDKNHVLAHAWLSEAKALLTGKK